LDDVSFDTCISGDGHSLPPVISSSILSFEGLGTADDLEDLARDTGLAGLVQGQGQLLDHFFRVLRRVVHGKHARGVLARGAFKERLVDLNLHVPRQKVSENHLGAWLEDVVEQTCRASLGRNNRQDLSAHGYLTGRRDEACVREDYLIEPPLAI